MIDNLIYDVGMHNGDDTAYYLHKGFEVIAIEADPDLCSKNALRFKNEINEGRLTILNIGIAPVSGTLDFWICEDNKVWNSFDRGSASRENLVHYSLKVKCQTFGWVLENYGVPHYLKIDIEGNDFLCIQALNKDRILPQYISVELGDIDKFLNKLNNLGYKKFKLISQFDYIPLELPPSKEQTRYEFWHKLTTGKHFIMRLIRLNLRLLRQERRIIYYKKNQIRRNYDWVFPFGASGPFGGDTVGRWHSSNEVRQVYKSYQKLMEQRKKLPYWTDKDYSFWVDLHAQ